MQKGLPLKTLFNKNHQIDPNKRALRIHKLYIRESMAVLSFLSHVYRDFMATEFIKPYGIIPSTDINNIKLDKINKMNKIYS